MNTRESVEERLSNEALAEIEARARMGSVPKEVVLSLIEEIKSLRYIIRLQRALLENDSLVNNDLRNQLTEEWSKQVKLHDKVTHLEEKMARLLRGDFTKEELQNICHNLPEDCPEAFANGCVGYNQKLFGDRSRLICLPVRGGCGVEYHAPSCACGGV